LSRSRLKRPEAPSQPLAWWTIALGPAVLVIAFGTLWGISNWVYSFPPDYKTTNGKILEIRKVVDGVVESQFGSKVVYGAEAHVQYVAHGQKQDRWLRASDNMSREVLFVKLASHPTECLVYWPPDQPENAKCWLK
jgi:hypothetical protein